MKTPVKPDRNRSLKWTSLLPSCAGIAAGALIVCPWMEQRAFIAPWVGMILLIALCHKRPPHLAFRYCFLAGLTFEAIGFSWYPAVASDVLQVSWFSGAMVVLMIFVWDAFRFALAGWVVRWLNPSAAVTCLVWPTVIVAFEWGWPHIFPWRIGQSQMGWLPILQIAEFTGAYGVSFAVVWGATCIAMLLCSFRNSSVTPLTHRSVRLQSGICAVCLVIVVGWGHWRITDIESRASQMPQLSVALLQPGSEKSARSYLYPESIRLQDDVDLIVWPESTAKKYSLDLTSFSDRDEIRAHSDSRSHRQQPVPDVDCHVLINGGSFPHESPKEGPFFNTSFLIDPQLQIVGRYHKRVLMPWGEYVVGQHKIPGLRELLGGYAEYLPGSSAAPLALPGGAEVGLLTCYEDLVESAARDSCRAGANVLINQSNLLSFGRSSAMWGHQQLSFIRAIETRRAFLRCGLVGSTAVFSPTGRRQQQAPPHVSASLTTKAPLFSQLTWYVVWGDVFAETCVVLTILFGSWQVFFRKTRPTKQATSKCQQKQARG